MSWPLLPVPMTSARLPLQASPSSYWLECSTVPPKFVKRRNVRNVRNAADAGRHHDVARAHLARRAVGAAQHDRPAAVRLVVGAALELGAGPVVELHALHIGLEPAGELVLRNVGRPVRRKRHVGQVIDLHLVVQRQRVIALAPVVADARLAIDDQRVDLQLREPRRDREPGLPAADDQHGRVAVGVGGGCLAQVEPVRAAEIARVGLAGRPRPADPLLVALDLVERGEQRPGLRRAAVGAGTSRSTPLPRPCAVSKLKIASIGARAGARHLARRGALRIEPEAGRRAARMRAFSSRAIASRAVDRPDVPGERQHVAPVAVGVKQRARARRRPRRAPARTAQASPARRSRSIPSSPAFWRFPAFPWAETSVADRNVKPPCPCARIASGADPLCSGE